MEKRGREGIEGEEREGKGERENIGTNIRLEG